MEDFYFISVPYMITELQVNETLFYITRGAKWSDVRNVLFSCSKGEKKNQLKHKNQARNRIFIESWVFGSERLCFSLRVYVYINFNKTNANLEIFCLHITEYLNTKKLFPICMFVVMASEKCEFHIYFTFIQEF